MRELKWQLYYLIREGIDLTNRVAAETLEAIDYGWLPDAERVLSWATETSPETADKKIQSRLDQFDKQIAKLAAEKDLKPAASELLPDLYALKSYAERNLPKPRPSVKERIWDWLRKFRG